MSSDDGHNYVFGGWPEMPWRRKEDSMYLMTVVQVPGEWRGREIPIKHPVGCHLHSVEYASPERIVCVWERDAYQTADEWGETARVGAEVV